MTVSGREKKGHQQGRLLLQLEVAWAAACYVALLVLCSLCYSNSLYGELVHDDVWAIVNNPDVRPGSSLRNIFRNDFWGKRMADNTSHKSYRPLCILTFNFYLLRILAKVKSYFCYKDFEGIVHSFIALQLNYCNLLLQ
uniref:Uncharacterized protein n=1 Tax=Xiphophorus couchianus TaxID=32473 RepID=A0A3B5L4K1_9TELE